MARRSKKSLFQTASFWWVVIALTWITGSMVFLLEDWTDTDYHMKWYAVLYMMLVVIASPITFVAYLLDKRKAKQGVWRIAEKSLHLMDFLGGWPGGMLAQKTFRHKTQKTSFQLVYWGTVWLHLIGVVGIFIWKRGAP